MKVQKIIVQNGEKVQVINHLDFEIRIVKDAGGNLGVVLPSTGWKKAGYLVRLGEVDGEKVLSISQYPPSKKAGVVTLPYSDPRTGEPGSFEP